MIPPISAQDRKELNAVFRAIYYRRIHVGDMFQGRALPDNDAIVRVLSGKTNAELRLFTQRYDQVYADAPIWGRRSPKTLLGDLGRTTSWWSSNRPIDKIRQRVKLLSVR